jgi:hypothetical protein
LIRHAAREPTQIFIDGGLAAREIAPIMKCCRELDRPSNSIIAKMTTRYSISVKIGR